MLFLIIFMGFLFIGLGFILTVDNAKYILSGYNTMSEEERKKVDINAYVPYFKNFHFTLGASTLFIGGLLSYFFSERATVLFVVCYPIVAYIYFILNSKRFSTGKYRKLNDISVIMLILTLLVVLALFLMGEL